MHRTQATSRPARRRVLPAAAIAAALVLAACGGDDDSDSSPAAPADTAAANPATTPPAAPPSAAPAVTGGSTAPSDSAAPPTTGSGSPEVDAATAFVTPFLSFPTEIPLTEPLAAPPEPGQTIVFLQCDVAQCKAISDGVKAAAELVGWNFENIPYDSTNPATLAAAMDQSLQYDPVAVAFTSPPYALWSQKVAQFAEAGVALIPSFTGEVPLDDTIIANPSSPEYAYRHGQLLGNWFIADSGAAGHALAVNVPDFPWLADVGQGFVDAVSEGCTGCEVTELAVGIPDLVSGAITDIVASAVRSDPSIDYIAAINAEFLLALPAALDAAGISDQVELFGCCSGAASQTALQAGTFAALTGVNGNYAGYITVDAALRFAEGSPIPDNEGELPMGLLVPDMAFTPSNSYDQPSDFIEQFKALWQI